jgi:hypothetical protein
MTSNLNNHINQFINLFGSMNGEQFINTFFDKETMQFKPYEKGVLEMNDNDKKIFLCNSKTDELKTVSNLFTIAVEGMCESILMDQSEMDLSKIDRLLIDAENKLNKISTAEKKLQITVEEFVAQAKSTLKNAVDFIAQQHKEQNSTSQDPLEEYKKNLAVLNKKLEILDDEIQSLNGKFDDASFEKLIQKTLLKSEIEESIKTLTMNFESTLINAAKETHSSPSASEELDSSSNSENNSNDLGLTGKIRNQGNHEQAIQMVDDFNVKSTFPCDLWDLSENHPTDRIPFRNFNEEEGKEEYFDLDKVKEFNNRLDTSIQTMLDLSLQMKDHDEIKKVCEELTEKLFAIKANAEKILLDMTSIDYTPEFIASLKMDDRLIMQLKNALKQAEREHLLKFLSNLATLTLEGKNQNCQKITNALEKLRQYITERHPRLRQVMGFNQCGVAQQVYDFCLEAFLSNVQEKETVFGKMTKKSNNDQEVIVASARNLSCHYTLNVRTNAGIVNLDSVGSRKNSGYSFDANDSNLILSELFYRSCQPIPMENITVPSQANNNCYLSAGWLKFCTFLHFFEQT